jgi:hypothetical protein
MATTVRRDPFVRGEYKRFVQGNRSWIYGQCDRLHLNWGCDWCGQKPARLYSYVWWADDKPEPMDDSGRWFCNLSCFETYSL